MIAQAGIDTWSPCWYVDPEGPAATALHELAVVPAQRSRLLPESVRGHRVGWFPGAGLVFAEGHPGGDRLGAPDQLSGVLEELVGGLGEQGIELCDGLTAMPWPSRSRRAGFAGVRRLDSTADLAFDTAAEGLAVLAGVAALQPPRQKRVVWRGTGGAIETVEFRGHSGARVLGRWYDTGVDKGTAPRGRLIRPEDQRRFSAGSRRDVTELSTAVVKSMFQRRFLPLWQASKGVTVAGAPVLSEKLRELVEAGEITPRMATTLAGHLMFEQNGRSPMSRATRHRHSAQVRRLGLVLSDGVMQEVEVDLHGVLEEIMESDAWDHDVVTGGQG